MKLLRSIFIITLAFNSSIAFCQTDTTTGCGDVVVIDRTPLSDSLTPPSFSKGDEYLIATIKKYFSFTDTIKVYKNESYVVGFNIAINNKGKISKSVVWTDYFVSNKFKEILPQFIGDIDCWLPAYQKGTKIPDNNYLISFFIDIRSERVDITQYNADNQLLNKLTTLRPLNSAKSLER